MLIHRLKYLERISSGDDMNIKCQSCRDNKLVIRLKIL